MKIDRIECIPVRWAAGDPASKGSAFLRVWTDDGRSGIGEVSPMQGGFASLGVLQREIESEVKGQSPFEHAMIYDRLEHKLIKLGPHGNLSGALAGLDIALWDLKGQALGLPVHRLLGGSWTTSFPYYSSIGRNGERSVDDVVRIVEERMQLQPAAIKIRFDSDRDQIDRDVEGDIEKAKAVRRVVGDRFPLAFDGSCGYSRDSAVRVGRELEQLGYWWFEEPVQHYLPKQLGEIANKLDITVAAGEQVYSVSGIAELIDAGVRMVQPDVIKMGGITGMMRCMALAAAHGVEFVPHQTQPMVGHLANLHVLATQFHRTKPAEVNDPSGATAIVFDTAFTLANGRYELPETPGLGLTFNDAELEKRRVPLM